MAGEDGTGPGGGEGGGYCNVGVTPTIRRPGGSGADMIVCENDEIASDFDALPSYDGACTGDEYNPPREDISEETESSENIVTEKNVRCVYSINELSNRIMPFCSISLFPLNSGIVPPSARYSSSEIS